MKRNIRRPLLAAICLFALARAADAVPIYFDFSGTISPGSDPALGLTDGGAVTGGFAFDTDQLAYNGQYGSSRSWFITQPADAAEPLAFLNFGGRELRFPAGRSAFGTLIFTDDCTPGSCSLGADSFSFFVSTSDLVDPEYSGIAHSYAFSFGSVAIEHLPTEPYVQFFDYFDGSQVDPLSILSLPLHDMSGTYFEDTLICDAGQCPSIGGQFFGFTVDTVTRGEGVRGGAVAVPEPGTTVLMAAGLAGLLLFRRRRVRAR